MQCYVRRTPPERVVVSLCVYENGASRAIYEPVADISLQLCAVSLTENLWAWIAHEKDNSDGELCVKLFCHSVIILDSNKCFLFYLIDLTVCPCWRDPTFGIGRSWVCNEGTFGQRSGGEWDEFLFHA